MGILEHVMNNCHVFTLVCFTDNGSVRKKSTTMLLLRLETASGDVMCYPNRILGGETIE